MRLSIIKLTATNRPLPRTGAALRNDSMAGIVTRMLWEITA